MVTLLYKIHGQPIQITDKKVIGPDRPWVKLISDIICDEEMLGPEVGYYPVLFRKYGDNIKLVSVDGIGKFARDLISLKNQIMNFSRS